MHENAAKCRRSAAKGRTNQDVAATSLGGESVMIATQVRSFIRPKKLAMLALRVGISLVLNPTLGYTLGTEAERAACTPDVVRLCGSEIPDVDRIIACMKAKRASLSTPCRLVVDARFPQGAAESSHQTP
jgi:hypothetical protein